MRDIVARLWRLYETPHGKRVFRFAMVSVISTAVSLAVLTLVYGVLRLWSEVPSTVFANLVATIPSYNLNRKWTWGKSGKSHLWREVVPFWSFSILGIAFSVVTSSGAKWLSTHFHLHHLASTVVVDLANLLAFAILWVAKFLFFNKLFHIPVVDDETDAEPAGLGAEVAIGHPTAGGATADRGSASGGTTGGGTANRATAPGASAPPVAPAGAVVESAPSAGAGDPRLGSELTDS